MEAKVITHTCEVCGKGFSSGKAYGGHWRSHLQKARQVNDEEEEEEEEEVELGFRQIRRIVSNNTPPKVNHLTTETTVDHHEESFSEEAAPFVIPCSLCDKGFSSMKALGGHMRSHPERDWRGINPPRAGPNPNPEPSPSDSTTSSSEIADLTQALKPSWVKREKRGRGSKSSELFNAAKSLIGMSRVSFVGHNINSQKWLKVRADHDSALRFRITTKKVETNSSSNGDKEIINSPSFGGELLLLEKKRKKTSWGSSGSNNNISEMDENVSLLLDSAKGSEINSKTTSSSLLYKCIDCEKCFSTFQGLGGHRSTHKKSNKKINSGTNGNYSQSTLVVEKNNINVTSLVDHDDEKMGQFQVKISESDRNRSVEMESPGIGFRGGQMLDFDLNEMP